MKRIAIGGLVGWSGIVALAWWLADRRIELCRYSSGYTCELRATAARDDVLIWGLTVALAAILLFAAAARYARFRRSGEVFPSPGSAYQPRRPDRAIGSLYRETLVAKARETVRRVKAGKDWVASDRGLFVLTSAMILFAFVWVFAASWLEPNDGADVMADNVEMPADEAMTDTALPEYDVEQVMADAEANLDAAEAERRAALDVYYAAPAEDLVPDEQQPPEQLTPVEGDPFAQPGTPVQKPEWPGTPTPERTSGTGAYDDLVPAR
jgi:hypothetical protein